MRRSHHLIFNAVSNTIGYAAATLAGLVLPPFVIGEIGADRYGLVVMLASVLQFVALVQLGTPQALQRFVARELALDEREKLSQLLSTGLALLGAAALVAAAAVAAVALLPELFLAHPEDLSVGAVRAVVLVMGGAAVLSMPLSIGQVAFYATGRFASLNVIQVVATLLRVALVFGLLWEFESSVVAYASANGAATVCGALLVFVFGRRLLPQVSLSLQRVTVSTARSIVGYGLLVFLNLFVFLFFVEADYVIVGWTLGPEQVTVLNLAIVWGIVLRGIAGSSLSVLTPSAAVEAARADTASLQQMLVRSTKYSLVFGLVPTLFLCGFRHEVMQTWMGEGFESASAIMIPLLMGELMTIATAGANGMLYGLGTVRPVLVINLVVGVCNVAVVATLTGVLGMGLASVAWTYFALSLARSGILFPVWFARHVGLQARVLYRKSYAGPLLAGVPLLALVPLLQPLARTGTWPALISTAALFALGSAPLLFFVAFDAYDRHVFLSMGARLLPGRRSAEP